MVPSGQAEHFPAAVSFSLPASPRLSPRRIVRDLEKGNLCLVEAIEVFRSACEHVREGEVLLGTARLGVHRLVSGAAGVRTEPMTA